MLWSAATAPHATVLFFGPAFEVGSPVTSPFGIAVGSAAPVMIAAVPVSISIAVISAVAFVVVPVVVVQGSEMSFAPLIFDRVLDAKDLRGSLAPFVLDSGRRIFGSLNICGPCPGGAPCRGHGYGPCTHACLCRCGGRGCGRERSRPGRRKWRGSEREERFFQVFRGIMALMGH